ncbi:MAG TPA: sigma-70 family RNA polymerase sigma factor [Gemmataceae bacterium]|nr:sigma-70 family RNA polymerase sigma factor [Gemmataceae bacterium]
MIEQRNGGSSHKDSKHLKSTHKVLCAVDRLWSEDLRRFLTCLHLKSYQIEDVIQGVWLTFLEKPPAFARGDDILLERLRPWLFRVARNLALGLIRSRNAHPTHALDALPAEPRDRHQEESTDWHEVRRQSERIDRWMEEVLRENAPRAYRLLCGCRDGETIEQLMAALGCSADAIHALLRRVRAKYRVWSTRQGEDEADN